MEDVSHMTGESEAKGSPVLKLNQIRLNGNTGEFMLVNLLGDKGADGYEKKVIGKEIKVIFLQHRRTLFQFRKGLKNYYTNEHRTKHDVVTLFGENVKGVAAELREKYQGLRTQQIIYSLTPKGEIVRVVAKGSSLMAGDGPDGKPDKVHNGYFNYLGLFDKAKNEHTHMVKTTLKSYGKEGPQGTYYAIDFVKSEPLTEEEQTKVNGIIKDLYAQLSEIEKYQITATPDKIAEQEKQIAETVDYPEEDIDPKDIPF